MGESFVNIYDEEVGNCFWEDLMEVAIKKMLEEYGGEIQESHIKNTPNRVIAAYKEYFAGVNANISELLTEALFESKHDQMIVVRDVRFFSTCAHHLAPISGTATFAYVPRKYIVGISKIPRLIYAYALRPQVQEDMSDQIVDAFMRCVDPMGCAVFVSADHLCMQCRGAKAQTAKTETTSLRGVFSHNSDTRNEFLMAVRSR